MEDSSCSRNTLKSSVTALVNGFKLTLCSAAAGGDGAIPRIAVAIAFAAAATSVILSRLQLKSQKDRFFLKVPEWVNVRIT